LLDTGVGLKKAAGFFLEDGGQSPFIVHNVDVLSNIDLARMLQFHLEQDALATLAVQDRPTSRPLLFDQRAQFRGRANQSPNEHGAESRPEMQALAFTGIHIISPRIFEKIDEEGAFSIITTYVRLAAGGEKILAFRADEYDWRDLGRPENVTLAIPELASGVYE
jgi:NDP-sugar pyrophosphorylase family protein